MAECWNLQFTDVGDVMASDDEILLKIQSAFSERTLPSLVIPTDVPPTDIYQDADNFLGKKWDSISCEELEKNPAATSGFTPQAFCYYLPGIMSASIRERRPDLIANAALVYMLDRSNTPSSWDNFFIERWGALNCAECRAVQLWILWLADANPAEFTDSELSRSFDTLEILSHRGTATPIASR